MPRAIRATQIPAILILVAWLQLPLLAEPVAVRHIEGLVHGFLVLSTLDGKPLAQGDLVQTSVNDKVSNHLVFRFRNGSIRDERTVFSQHGAFRLLSYRLTQKGPAFKRPMEMTFDSQSGTAGKSVTGGCDAEAKAGETGDHPARPGTLLSRRLQTNGHLLCSEDRIGGVAGAIAPLLGKQPPEIHIWALGGEAPAFVKMKGPLYDGGPPWRIELASPVWPTAGSGQAGTAKKMVSKKQARDLPKSQTEEWCARHDSNVRPSGS